MIGLLTGTIELLHRNPIILNVHGVGYNVFVPDSFFKSHKEHQHVSLNIYTHVREDALTLYGFPNIEDRDMFELLLSVSGIGPKTGLSIVSRGKELIERAIRQSDVSFFTDIPRLGKKNAQKIIIELKNKLGSITELNLADMTETAGKEILDTLISMGFSKYDVRTVLSSMNLTDPLEVTLREALRRLGSKR